MQAGGMRGIYSMGALAALEDAGLRDAFAVVVGTSAGAINGAYFLAGQVQEALRLYVEQLASHRFVNRWRLNKIVDVDYLIDVVMKQNLPLNLEVLRNSNTLLKVVVANADTGEEEIFTNRSLGDDFYEVMRASVAIPGLYNKKVLIGESLYVDGGTVHGIPVRHAVNEGVGAVLTILTRNPGYRKLTKSVLYRIAARAMARGQSKSILNHLGHENDSFNKTMAMLEGKNGVEDFCGWTLWPSDHSELVSRSTIDKGKLQRCSAMGWRDMNALLDRELDPI
ncbi:patatin-like phospholipase family protein [Umezawaea sp. NPDC059074]|uniref:patatin-like phospholipase family protein n=1 Tax=Umezawaea sp. NPDC059074 TaxID=3346716 RepID=UPI0036A0D581